MKYVDRDKSGSIIAVYSRPQRKGHESVEGAVRAKSWSKVRAERAELFNESDLQINIIEDAGGDATKWRTYRQKLRDITKDFGSADKVKWPKKPAK